MIVIYSKLQELSKQLDNVISDTVYPVSKKRLSAGLNNLNAVLEDMNIELQSKPTVNFRLTDATDLSAKLPATINVIAETVKIENNYMLFYIGENIVFIHPKVVSLEVIK